MDWTALILIGSLVLSFVVYYIVLCRNGYKRAYKRGYDEGKYEGFDWGKSLFDQEVDKLEEVNRMRRKDSIKKANHLRVMK